MGISKSVETAKILESLEIKIKLILGIPINLFFFFLKSYSMNIFSEKRKWKSWESGNL
jgi:hypothetical protein